MRNGFKEILNTLFKWNKGGERILDNGTILICQVPHIAPKAWLHIIYPPILLKQIAEIEVELSISLPEDLKEFLLTTNGINIFSDSLSIYGKRTSYVRQGDEAIQPYDLATHHSEEKSYIPENFLVIGSYSWDGSKIIFNLDTNQIHRCQEGSSVVMQSWDNLKTFLVNEIIRLSILFDDNGIEHDDDVPTTP
jgi:hypothetical protein